MKSLGKCDWCGKEFVRETSQLKGKKHHFCSKQCLASFSNKIKNPNGYKTLKDFTNISARFTRINKQTNKFRMTPEVREKLRQYRLNTGSGKGYAKLYGRHVHRIVAEKKLGRALLPGEVVHHVDGNKRNNDPCNIRVFKSQREHAKYHVEMDEFNKKLDKLYKREVMPHEVHTT